VGMVGVAPEDDDGNAASNTLPEGIQHRASSSSPTPANREAAPEPEGSPVGPVSPQPSPPQPKAPQAAPSPQASIAPPPPGRAPMRAPGS
jgi:hypothetical protein